MALSHRMTVTAAPRAAVPGAAHHARCTRTCRSVARKVGPTVYNFITVDQGLKKVKHMLDFGKAKRLTTLHKLYGNLDPISLNEVLADDFIMLEKELEQGSKRKYSKQDYIDVISKVVVPAIPDFSWGHLTNGDVDDDGFCIVTVKASGRHTGAPFVLPGMPPIPPSGGRFTLAQETHKVRVAGTKVTHVIALPSMDSGPRALYQALQELAAQHSTPGAGSDASTPA